LRLIFLVKSSFFLFFPLSRKLFLPPSLSLFLSQISNMFAINKQSKNSRKRNKLSDYFSRTWKLVAMWLLPMLTSKANQTWFNWACWPSLSNIWLIVFAITEKDKNAIKKLSTKLISLFVDAWICVFCSQILLKILSLSHLNIYGCIFWISVHLGSIYFCC